MRDLKNLELIKELLANSFHAGLILRQFTSPDLIVYETSYRGFGITKLFAYLPYSHTFLIKLDYFCLRFGIVMKRFLSLFSIGVAS
jgi:hypothetical protein